MRISDLRPYRVNTAGGRRLLLRVETDEGIYGWGELVATSFVPHFRELLVGRDPMRRGDIWQELHCDNPASGVIVTTTIAAIDVALHDIVGKKLQVPVYELLGGRQRDYVPCFATCWQATAEEMVAGVGLLLDEGWEAIRIGLLRFEGEDLTFDPRRSLQPTADLVRQVREKHGHDFVLGMEYHGRLNVAEAATFCQMLPPHGIDFLEEGLRPPHNPDAYEALRQLTQVPFAIGEAFTSKWEFAPFIERGLTNYVRLDIYNVGGFTEATKIAAMAEAHYIDLMPHNAASSICAAASAHLALAVQNFSWLEIRESATEQLGFYDPEVFVVQPELRGSKLFVPERPGLGIEVNEQLLEELDESVPTTVWGDRLRRSDGTVTSW